MNYLATFTEESDFTPFDGADTIECAGKFGQDCGEPLPEYNHRATVNYARNNWTAQVVWRHIGSTDDDDENNTYFVENLDSEDYIDASARYEFSNGMSLMAGVDNLMDSNPPILGDNQEQANTYPATYDVFGRTYFVRFGWEM